MAVQAGTPALGNDLDSGEAEAIALATEIQAGVLPIDDKKGRSVASSGRPFRARRIGGADPSQGHGEIASVIAEIDALRNMAGFIAASPEIDVLRSVGE
jgi:hypothetical protein